MKITCPHCGLVGKIGEDKLKASSGSIRCPRCRETFTPIDEKPPAGGRPGPSKKGTPKKEPVLFGARSGDDIPFTKIMEDNDLRSDRDVDIEIEAIDMPNSLGTDSPEEIISLGEDDIVSTGDEGYGLTQTGGTGPPEEIPVAGTPGEIPGIDIELEVPMEPPPPSKPKRPLFGIFGTGTKPPKETPPPAAVRPAPRRAGIRKGFILFFIAFLALWGGYRFFSIYWPPYVQEKEFLTDSRALFDKYHELRVYLKVGMPDPVFATKVAEAAYVWEVYREKHESHYRKDPLFASLMIMGRLFLTIKELLDRDMYPDNYLGLEWGEGFAFLTKEEYVGAMVAGIPICIKATEDNFLFSKQLLDLFSNLNFVSMTTSEILTHSTGPSRAAYGADLKRANDTFMTLDSQMPVLETAVVDVRSIVKSVSGK
jgi:predicted Zn finger-like uncharacterized protein